MGHDHTYFSEVVKNSRMNRLRRLIRDRNKVERDLCKHEKLFVKEIRHELEQVMIILEAARARLARQQGVATKNQVQPQQPDLSMAQGNAVSYNAIILILHSHGNKSPGSFDDQGTCNPVFKLHTCSSTKINSQKT